MSILQTAELLISPDRHCFWLWHLIERDIYFEYPLKVYNSHGDHIDWDLVLNQLKLPLTIQSLQINMDVDGAGMFCGGDREYELRENEVITLYLEKITMFLWIWGAFEATIDLICDQNKDSAYRKAISYLKRNEPINELKGLNELTEAVMRILTHMAPELAENALRESSKNNENKYLFLHVCRLLRNRFLHGKKGLPNIDDICPKCGGNRIPEKHSEILLLDGLNQLTLFGIQSIMSCFFSDKPTPEIYFSVTCPQ
ncbi:MAG TPA: hypothetical protein V6C52_11020 [Coleofasciculaceae cyanobacterium]|jgi:hypothetical protein